MLITYNNQEVPVGVRYLEQPCGQSLAVHELSPGHNRVHNLDQQFKVTHDEGLVAYPFANNPNSNDRCSGSCL
jgi:hypothetical protein